MSKLNKVAGFIASLENEQGLIEESTERMDDQVIEAAETVDIANMELKTIEQEVLTGAATLESLEMMADALAEVGDVPTNLEIKLIDRVRDNLSPEVLDEVSTDVVASSESFRVNPKMAIRVSTESIMESIKKAIKWIIDKVMALVKAIASFFGFSKKAADATVAKAEDVAKSLDKKAALVDEGKIQLLNGKLTFTPAHTCYFVGSSAVTVPKNLSEFISLATKAGERLNTSVAAARTHYDEFTAFLQKDHSTAAVKYAAGQAYGNMDKLFTTGMFKEHASGEFQTWVSPCAIGGRQVVVEGRLGKRAEKELKGSEWEGSLKPPVVKSMISARAQGAQSKPMAVDSLHAIKGAVTVLRDTGRYVEQLQDKFDDTIARSEALEADFKKLEQEKGGEKPVGYYNAIIANVRLHVLVVTKLRELTNLTIYHYRDVVKNLDLLNKALVEVKIPDEAK
jgi:hypothetical protein